MSDTIKTTRLQGNELVVDRDPTQDHSHEDPYVALRDAFDAMERRLESFTHRRRGEVKSHALPAVGTNLHDHLGVYLTYRCNKPVTLYGFFRPDRAAMAGLQPDRSLDHELLVQETLLRCTGVL